MAAKRQDLLIKMHDGFRHSRCAAKNRVQRGDRVRTRNRQAQRESRRRRRQTRLFPDAACSRAATDALMRQTFFDGAVKNYQIIIPDFGTVQGAYQITNLEFAGEHNGEVTYDVALESAGEQTFAAA
jgi:hypothetical protein